MEGLSVVAFGRRRHFINVFPSDCPIEVANSEGADFGRFEETNVYLNLALRLKIHRQNVRCAPASATADEAPCAFAPNVFLGSIGIKADSHGVQGIEGPQCTEPLADGAIAARNRLWGVRQRDLDRAAVTGG
jgi:hypothetical protein